MSYRNNVRARRPAMYNTPAIRNGGFGALQVEAITNRPLSIARRHLAASVLRIREIEPDELSSSEWVRFLVMEDQERERWMSGFLRRRRRNSDESTASTEEGSSGQEKAEEARTEGGSYGRSNAVGQPFDPSESMASIPRGTTPMISLWAREFDGPSSSSATSTQNATQRPLHPRQAVMHGVVEAPPTYESVVRPHTPPPAYEAPQPEGSRSPFGQTSP